MRPFRTRAIFITADGNARHFRRLDRNRRVRLMFLAERLDARTKEPGKHGGCLGRTTLAVLKVLLFHFLSVATGRLDPSYNAIAAAAAVARSTAAKAPARLEAAGILERVPRLRWVRVQGRKLAVRATNLYRLNVPPCFRATEGDWARSPESESRLTTTSALKNQLGFENAAGAAATTVRPVTAPAAPTPVICEELQRALARLGYAIADRRDAEREEAERNGPQLRLAL